MSQLPPSRKYATRSHQVEPQSLNDKLNSVVTKAASKTKNSPKKTDHIDEKLEKCQAKKGAKVTKGKSKKDLEIEQLEKEISLLGKTTSRKRNDKSIARGKSTKKEERGRSNENKKEAPAKPQKTVKRHTKTKEQSVAVKASQSRKRQKTEAAVRPKSQAPKPAKKTQEAKASTRQSARQAAATSNINKLVSKETEKQIQKAIQSQKQRKAAQKKKSPPKQKKETKRAKSVKTSVKASPKSSRSPSRCGRSKKQAAPKVNDKSRKAKSVAVSRRQSRKPSQNRKSRKQSMKQEVIMEDIMSQQVKMEVQSLKEEIKETQHQLQEEEDIVIPQSINTMTVQDIIMQNTYVSPKRTPIEPSRQQQQYNNNAQIVYIKDHKSSRTVSEHSSPDKNQECFQINTCTQEQDHEMEDDCQSEEAPEVKQQMIVPEQIQTSLALKLLSRETLEIIKKLQSNKPTPTVRPSLSFSFSSKRINSDKPTPCLESKLNEIRNGNNSIISQLNHSQMPNHSQLPQKSSFNMYEFFQAPDLSETPMLTPMKEQINREVEEQEDAKSEDEHLPTEEEEKVQQVIEQVKNEIKEDTRENSAWGKSPAQNDIDSEELNDELMAEVYKRESIQSSAEKKQPSKVEKKVNEIIKSNISMSDKYSHLVDDEIKELPLPVHYKILLNQFAQLDFNMNHMKRKKQTTTFTSLKKALEGSMGKRFTLENFQQILTIVPNFFNHRWELKNGGKSQELIIEYPKNIRHIIDHPSTIASEEAFEETLNGDYLEKRKNRFHDTLMCHTQQYFKEKLPELLEKPENQQTYDKYCKIPIKDRKLWPHFFAHDSAPEIEKSKFNEVQKTAKQTETIADFLNKYDRNSTMMVTSQALSKAQEESPFTINLSPENPKLTQSSEKMTIDDGNLSMSTAMASTQSGLTITEKTLGLSFETLRAVQMRQEKQEESRRKNEEVLKTQEQKKTIEQYNRTILQIYSLFSFQSTNCMGMAETIERLDDKQRGSFQSKDLIKEKITEIATLLPEWIKISSNAKGEMIRILNRRISPDELTKRVTKAIINYDNQDIIDSSSSSSFTKSPFIL